MLCALLGSSTLPKNMIGRYSLEAWGYRLGILKGTYMGGRDEWSLDMQDYMKQDGLVTVALWNRSVKEAALGMSLLKTPTRPRGRTASSWSTVSPRS